MDTLKRCKMVFKKIIFTINGAGYNGSRIYVHSDVLLFRKSDCVQFSEVQQEKKYKQSFLCIQMQVFKRNVE